MRLRAQLQLLQIPGDSNVVSRSLSQGLSAVGPVRNGDAAKSGSRYPKDLVSTRNLSELSWELQDRYLRERSLDQPSMTNT